MVWKCIDTNDIAFELFLNIQMETDEYRTISNVAKSEIKIKGSRFIAYAAPVANRKEAEGCYTDRALRYADATHNCFAYKLDLGDLAEWRTGDDGEPAGTAGKPILQTIEGKDLSNVIVIVTRYFGGTKLGVGGLIRAYGAAATEVLNHVSLVTKYLTVSFNVAFPYNMTNAVMKQVANFKADIIKSVYDTEPNLDVRVRQTLADSFRSMIIDSTAGRASVKTLGID